MLAATALVLAPMPALSQETMVLRANVVRSCHLAALPMMFGTVSILFPDASVQTPIYVDCTPNTNYTVAIDNGRNFNGQRRMARIGTGLGSFLNYEIYSDAARTQRWGSTPAQVVTRVAPANGKTTLYAYGRTTGFIAAGPFEDVVTITITF
ncbi:spore coat U domain-containing protein [Qipengyuania sediminis]|uniref:Csu type fimbrial protein n=1 Tax=Qipengyuania sediminis TaxID=1532023 RepID=UPI0014050D0F|nr:spore coat U domain-containing protein [Qipengyuania sediminis]